MSARVEVVGHVRIVDAESGTGIEGAEILIGGLGVEKPGWRAEQIVRHQRDPPISAPACRATVCRALRDSPRFAMSRTCHGWRRVLARVLPVNVP